MRSLVIPWNALDSLSLEQFDGFGHAVHAVVDLARRSTRGSSIAVLTGTLDAMEELAQ